MEDTAPRGAYRCGDGAYVALSGGTQEVAERVLRTIGGDALVADLRFRTNADRVANGEALDALIDAFCMTRPRDEVIGVLTSAGCAVGPLESIDSTSRTIARASHGTRSRSTARAPRRTRPTHIADPRTPCAAHQDCGRAM